MYIEPLSLRRTHKIGNHYLLPSFYFTTGADALVYIIFGKCLFACGIVLFSIARCVVAIAVWHLLVVAPVRNCDIDDHYHVLTFLPPTGDQDVKAGDCLTWRV